ncbi:hypothetical protein ACE6H2_025453 [Prunus campanulata]
MRIPGPTESLSKPKDGEAVFFTDVLQQGVRLPLQAPVQRILAHIGYAPGQFNPNFWAVLMGCRLLRSPGEIGGCCSLAIGNRLQGFPEYPQFLFTENLIKARLANPAEMTDERKKAEAKKMSETSKRRLGVIAKGKKQKRQPEASAERVSEADLEEQPLSERQRQRTAEPIGRRVPVDEPLPSPGVAADAASSKASGKRPLTVDLDAASTPKRTVQFANHMIVGSQMELSEIDELPKRALREEAGRAFRLQATLCMKRAINAAERSKRMYEDGRAKVADAAKALQDHASLVQDMHAAERQIQAHEAKLAEMREALDGAERAAKDAEEARLAVQSALEASERTKAAEVEAAVRGAIRDYRSSTEFTSLVDNEVASEMADLIYRFKRFNPGQKLNLNFAADPPPLPEGITEEMIEEYEGEDAPEDAEGTDAEGPPDASVDAANETADGQGDPTAEA